MQEGALVVASAGAVWWFTGGVRRAGVVIAKCSHCIVLLPLPAGGSRHGTGGALTSFPTFRLLGLLALWLVVGAARVGVQRSPDAYLREGVHQGC